MRFLIAAIVIGPLMLTGARSNAAGAAAAAAPSAAADTQVQPAAGSARTAEWNSYVEKVRSNMAGWQRKLQDYGRTAAAKGKEAGSASADNLNKAWTRAKAASHKVQSAGAEGWESAKASFEKASRDLKDAWDKVQSPSHGQ